MSTLTKPRLIYFNSRGLAELIRIVLAETKTDYDDVTITSFTDPLFVSLRDEGKLTFGQVPLWEEPSGFHLVQSSAIVRYLAKKNGLVGKNDDELAQIDAIWEFWVDSRNYATGGDPKNREERKKLFTEEHLPKSLDRLEKILKANGTGFLVGSQLSYADIAWWYWLENLSDQGLVDLSKWSEVSKFKAAIEARPNIAAYRADPKRRPVQYYYPRYAIYSYPGNNNANKALIAAAFGGIKVETPTFAMGVDNKTPEFLKKNPNGQVPTLDSPDGPIYESNAICLYLARKGSDKGLLGANEYEQSLVNQWIEWSRSHLEKEITTWVVPIFGWAAFDKEKYEAAKSTVAKKLAILDAHLSTSEWIVGKRVTVADIVLFCGLANGFNHLFSPEFLVPLPNLVAWAKRCYELPQFKIVKLEFATHEKQAGELARH